MSYLESPIAGTALPSAPVFAEMCRHCGLAVPKSRRAVGDQPALIMGRFQSGDFCCAGCEYVFCVIQELGLSEYYALKDQLPSGIVLPAKVSHSNFGYLDDSAFAAEFVTSLPNEQCRLEFVVEGMHCAACVWLLERLPEICDGVSDARVTMGSRSVSIDFDRTRVAPSSIAGRIDSLGYHPHPKHANAAREVREKERRDQLSRIGVAGMSSGNTMLLAISLYQGWFSGIEAQHERFLQWASFGLALPAVCYSAVPFYRAALGSLRAKQMHIDVPISIGIVAGFIVSVYNTLRGNPDVYFDSLCMLIFLLLVGRWLQSSGVDRAVDSSELPFTVMPRSAHRVDTGSEPRSVSEVFVGSLRAGDLLEVHPGELFPADAEITRGSSSVDRAVLTGESRPIRMSPGDFVFAGTRNIEQLVECVVTSVGNQSRMGRLVNELERSQAARPPIVELTNRLASRFVSVVLTAAAMTFLYWFFEAGVVVATNNALALLVVSCPCALGLAAPVTCSVALRRAARDGVLIRNAETFERLVRAKQVVWDKTGTLTYGAPTVRAINLFPGFSLNQALGAAVSLEETSQHPVAAAVRAYAEREGNITRAPAFRDLAQQIGSGMSGYDAEGLLWRIGSRKWLESSGVCFEHAADFAQLAQSEGLSPMYVARGSELALGFAVGDAVREEAAETLKSVERLGLVNGMCSGDDRAVVEAVGKHLHMQAELCSGELSPEEKALAIAEQNTSATTVMVGDGANDASALAAASVGIAVSGGAELSLQAADVFLASNDLRAIPMLIEGSNRVLRTIRRSLRISLLYNICAGLAAATGHISPLAAAILMPISSLTVIGSALTLLRTSFAPPRLEAPVPERAGQIF